jgi:hypothetical protein
MPGVIDAVRRVLIAPHLGVGSVFAMIDIPPMRRFIHRLVAQRFTGHWRVGFVRCVLFLRGLFRLTMRVTFVHLFVIGHLVLPW